MGLTRFREVLCAGWAGLAREGAGAPHRDSPPSPGLDGHGGSSCVGGCPASGRALPLHSGPGGRGGQGPSQAPGTGGGDAWEGDWAWPLPIRKGVGTGGWSPRGGPGKGAVLLGRPVLSGCPSLPTQISLACLGYGAGGEREARGVSVSPRGPQQARVCSVMAPECRCDCVTLTLHTWSPWW